jgi:hypothetical protein
VAKCAVRQWLQAIAFLPSSRLGGYDAEDVDNISIPQLAVVEETKLYVQCRGGDT